VTDPLPAEYLPFHWEQAGPLVLDLRTLPGQELNLRLYDADHNLVGEAGPLAGVTAPDEEIPRDPWRLIVADLPAGVYALGVDGAEEVTEYLLTFVSVAEAPSSVYLPVLLRQGQRGRLESKSK
jgi:hypothetical protein